MHSSASLQPCLGHIDCQSAGRPADTYIQIACIDPYMRLSDHLLHVCTAAAGANRCHSPHYMQTCVFYCDVCLQGGADGLAGATDAGWAQPIGAAVLGIRHMGMSGWEPAECAAVENELTAWQQAGNFASKEHALRWALDLVGRERALQREQCYFWLPSAPGNRLSRCQQDLKWVLALGW